MELTHYQRNLPHILPPGETIFVTFRLADSLPRIALEKLKAEWESLQTAPDETTYARQKRYFGRFDQLLDQASNGPLWLRESEVADLVQGALHHYDDRAYSLICHCLMPNHVHAVVTLPDGAPPLTRTLQHLKGFTAQHANRLLSRTGQFWQRESYDHVVRDANEMQRIVSYVLENPVKAGLIDEWQKWPYTYWNEL